MPASGSRCPTRASCRRGSTRSLKRSTPHSAAAGRTSRAPIRAGELLCAGTIGARVGHAAALAQARGAGSGLAALDAIPRDSVVTYQPYWALRAHLLKRLGRADEAAQAFARAIGLSEDGAVREFLAGEAAG